MIEEKDEKEEEEEKGEISFDIAKKYSGYLEKKSNGLFSKWQKRYFHILEGKIIVYSEKPEDIEVKGLFILDQISNPKSVNEREFSFILEGRDFVLRAENSQEKENYRERIEQLQKENEALKAENQKLLNSFRPAQKQFYIYLKN